MSAEHAFPPPVPLYKPIEGDRAEYWRRLRSTYGEVAPVELEPGVNAWLLLSWAANRTVMSDDRTFARDPGCWRDLQDGTISRESGTWAVWHKRATALLSDGDEHRYLSGALSHSFARLDEQRTLGQIRQVADHLIDGFAARGQVDLIGQYARLLPLHVLCRLFGMNPPQVAAITEQMSLIWQGHPETALAAVKKMRALLINVAERARAEPDRNALPTLLIEQGHTDVQVGDQLSLVVSAAADPVAHTIGAALRKLLSDPELARARSTLLVSETVNLILARDTPLETIVARHPRHDVELGGYRIRKGDCLVFGFAAASQDLYKGLRVDRIAGNRAHLTFGAGAHRCPHYGRDLALVMAETAITVLYERLPDLCPSTSPAEHRWLPTTNLRGLVDLPARFTSRSPVRAAPVGVPPHVQEAAWNQSPRPGTPQKSSSTRPCPATTPTPRHVYSTKRAPWRRWRFLTDWWSRR